MASLRVKTLRSFGEIRGCGLGGGRRPRQRPEGFVTYARNDDSRLRRRNFSRAARLVVVNSNRNFRSDWDSGASSSSAFDHHRHQGSSTKLGSLATSIAGSSNRQRRDEDTGVDVAGKLDLWVQESVVEILNNLEEAPFLVHVYSDGEEGWGSGSSSSTKTRLVREKASCDSWPLIKGRWSGENPAPNGIILVEEMAASANGDDSGSGISDACSSTTKVWGILIQGKGLSFPACYILKTCRIRSVFGCCTHFCLSKVDCFFESADIQLKKLWLV